ncbi:uncharacterized protein [Palaemon carinicauda]|uniref:uncharacterized protein n=1 Tax=Palaemon carinicauda TaxID=392227 RepID=UPI0035B604FF
MRILKLIEFCRSKLRPTGNASTARDSSQNEERPFWEENKFIHTVATALGLHIITRTGPKCYAVSLWKLLPTCAYMLGNVYTFSVIGYILYMNVLSTYQLVLMFPTFCNCGSCCYSFILILKRSGQMAKYFTIIDEEGAAIRKTRYKPIWFFPMLIYSTVFTAMLVVSDKIIPSEYSCAMIYPTFTGTFMPAFLDIYIFSFIRMIISSLEKLGRSVQNTKHWTEETVISVAKKWIRIHGFLDTSNKIFSYVLHVRLVMFILKGMLFMYSLSLMKEDIGDPYLVTVTISGVNEVTLRIFLICKLGNDVVRAIS